MSNSTEITQVFHTLYAKSQALEVGPQNYQKIDKSSVLPAITKLLPGVQAMCRSHYGQLIPLVGSECRTATSKRSMAGKTADDADNKPTKPRGLNAVQSKRCRIKYDKQINKSFAKATYQAVSISHFLQPRRKRVHDLN